MTPASDELVQHDLETGTYGYTATDVNKLEGTTEYTLVTVVVDRSFSVEDFKSELEKMIQEIVKSCKMDARAENLMLRIVQFGSDLEEIHGFKLLTQCNESDYNDSIIISGNTALYDSTMNSIQASYQYCQSLVENDFDINVVNFILTDGGENASHSVSQASEIEKQIKDIRQSEKLESIINILIGVGVGEYGNTHISKLLQEFYQDAGLDQYIETKDVTPQELAKLGNFISKSISSQSRALGSGGPSQLLTF
jgi:hypothetical protein